jgi:hypothetical protein
MVESLMHVIECLIIGTDIFIYVISTHRYERNYWRICYISPITSNLPINFYILYCIHFG